MGSGGESNPIVLYGVIIQDALARGEKDEMERVAAAARAHLDHYGDIAQGLAHLQTAIRGDKGPPVIPLYAVALQKAIDSGDQKEIAALMRAAKKQISQGEKLRKALSTLKREIKKLEKKGK